MNLDNMKASSNNILAITDSLNAPLLRVSIKPNSTTVAPAGNDLIVYVDTSETPTEMRKTYLFSLESPLDSYEDVSDELIIEPRLEGAKVRLHTYVKRNLSDGDPLYASMYEELQNQAIVLFEGTNYIYTNYENITIDVVYPKDSDLVSFFLNNFIYGVNNEDKILSLEDIYFKDCFTQVDTGINAEFSKLTIKCMDSINNNFSLDCDGNLVVNSITTRQESSSSSTIDFNSIYPVGSVYLSVVNTNPSTLFGGTWEQITGYYLYAGNGGTIAGSNTSGTPTVDSTSSTAITVAQMPSHTHIQDAHCHTENPLNYVNNINSYDIRLAGSATGYYGGVGLIPYYTSYTTATNQYTGGNQGHTHTLSAHGHSVTPLRFEVYMWKRVS